MLKGSEVGSKLGLSRVQDPRLVPASKDIKKKPCHYQHKLSEARSLGGRLAGSCSLGAGEKPLCHSQGVRSRTRAQTESKLKQSLDMPYLPTFRPHAYNVFLQQILCGGFHRRFASFHGANRILSTNVVPVRELFQL